MLLYIISAIIILSIFIVAILFLAKDNFELQKKNYRPYLQHLYDRPYWWYWPNSVLTCDEGKTCYKRCDDAPWFGYRSSWY